MTAAVLLHSYSYLASGSTAPGRGYRRILPSAPPPKIPTGWRPDECF